jgi:hypothetical protein
MQGLADGYFILPLTIGDYLARGGIEKIDASHAEFRRVEAEINERTQRMLNTKGRRTVTQFHRELGKLMWDYCGMARNAAGLKKALTRIPELREEFWAEVNVPGSGANLNQSLEHAGRVADFMEFAELMCIDALERDESCGGHFREEHQILPVMVPQDGADDPSLDGSKNLGQLHDRPLVPLVKGDLAVGVCPVAPDMVPEVSSGCVGGVAHQDREPVVGRGDLGHPPLEQILLANGPVNTACRNERGRAERDRKYYRSQAFIRPSKDAVASGPPLRVGSRTPLTTRSCASLARSYRACQGPILTVIDAHTELTGGQSS